MSKRLKLTQNNKNLIGLNLSYVLVYYRLLQHVDNDGVMCSSSSLKAGISCRLDYEYCTWFIRIAGPMGLKMGGANRRYCAYVYHPVIDSMAFIMLHLTT